MLHNVTYPIVENESDMEKILFWNVTVYVLGAIVDHIHWNDQQEVDNVMMDKLSHE